jgi:hypothetical protein
MPRVYNKHHANVPRDAVYIGRGSLAGNPYRIGSDGDRDEVCDKYEAMVEANPTLKRRLIAYCVGKDLVCFCSPRRCHGDYLLKISNPSNK